MMVLIVFTKEEGFTPFDYRKMPNGFFSSTLKVLITAIFNFSLPTKYESYF